MLVLKVSTKDRGFYPRAVALVVQNLCKFSCEVNVSDGSYTINGKNLFGMLRFDQKPFSELQFTFNGEDESAAIGVIKSLFINNFDQEI